MKQFATHDALEEHPMSLISTSAIAVALVALVSMAAFGLPDQWFCGLLALAATLGAAEAAYREVTGWASALLAMAVALSGAALHAALRPGRERERP